MRRSDWWYIVAYGFGLLLGLLVCRAGWAAEMRLEHVTTERGPWTGTLVVDLADGETYDSLAVLIDNVVIDNWPTGRAIEDRNPRQGAAMRMSAKAVPIYPGWWYNMSWSVSPPETYWLVWFPWPEMWIRYSGDFAHFSGWSWGVPCIRGAALWRDGSQLWLTNGSQCVAKQEPLTWGSVKGLWR